MQLPNRWKRSKAKRRVVDNQVKPRAGAMIRHRPSVHFGVTHSTLCDPGRPYVRLAFEPNRSSLAMAHYAFLPSVFSNGTRGRRLTVPIKRATPFAESNDGTTQTPCTFVAFNRTTLQSKPIGDEIPFAKRNCESRSLSLVLTSTRLICPPSITIRSGHPAR